MVSNMNVKFVPRNLHTKTLCNNIGDPMTKTLRIKLVYATYAAKPTIESIY